MRKCLVITASLLAGLALSGYLQAQSVYVRVSHEIRAGINGTNEFPTIQMALDHHLWPGKRADGSPGHVYIRVAPGFYHERIIVTQNHPNITLVGMRKSPADVVITNSLNAKQAGGTFFTETVEINGTGFEADNITFENTAGNTGRLSPSLIAPTAPSLSTAAFWAARTHSLPTTAASIMSIPTSRAASIFIFGNATAVFDHDELHSNGLSYLTA